VIYTVVNTPPGTIVYVDGKPLSHVFYVDLKRGIVDRYRTPIKLDKYKKRVITERIRSKNIKLKFPEESNGVKHD
jgi:hypothetical protein